MTILYFHSNLSKNIIMKKCILVVCLTLSFFAAQAQAKTYVVIPYDTISAWTDEHSTDMSREMYIIYLAAAWEMRPATQHEIEISIDIDCYSDSGVLISSEIVQMTECCYYFPYKECNSGIVGTIRDTELWLLAYKRKVYYLFISEE